jgi:glutaryl-CoA dehydrogenase
MNAPEAPRTRKAAFRWDDPLLLDAQLTEDERMVRDAARDYCQDKLAPRVLDAFRHERTDLAIFREPASTTSATASSRARSSAWTRASAR